MRAVDLVNRGYLVFHMEDSCKLMKVHVYETWAFEGDPMESEEMRPQWFSVSNLPFESMWPDDPHWLPLLLSGNKVIIGRYWSRHRSRSQNAELLNLELVYYT